MNTGNSAGMITEKDRSNITYIFNHKEPLY